jgi:predicted enzyme related to lactoylglutathione lyase
MKKASLLILIIAVSFCFGFAFKTIISKQPGTQAAVKKVTGIGGVFFKCKDPDKMREWYNANLGLQTNPYGAVFEWYQGADSTKKGFTQWSPFKETTKYFEPSAKDFMVNYRVADIESIVEVLKQNGVATLDSIQSYDYGKFVHLLDPEGNKIELWEPEDIAYEKLGSQMGSKTTK